MEDDAELIERYLNGDRMAGSLLVARHSPALFGWLHWKTGCREDAEDLTQTVWTQAFPALPRLHDRAAFRAWLFTLCRHAFAHWLRERRCTRSLDAPDTNMEDLATMDGVLQAVEDRVALQNALMQLSEEHRDTFLLKYVSQFSAPEIAQILDIPVGTVESRCHFARARLRQWLVQSEAAGEAQTTPTPSASGRPDDAHPPNAKRQDAKPSLFRAASAGVRAKKPGPKGFTK